MIDLDIASTARSPGGKFSLTAQNREFPTASLTRDEADLLERQMETLVTNLDSGVLGKVIQQRQETIAKTAAFAKQVFDEKNFEGVNAGDNSIGFSPLRPGHIMTEPETADSDNWYFDPGTTGWVDFIGDGTSSGNYTVGDDQVSIVFAVVDQDVDSEMSAINVETFGRNVDMLPLDLNSLGVPDNKNEIKTAALPSLIAQENDDIYVKARFDRNVESQPRLFGFTFGLGTYLDTEDYDNS